MSAINEQKTQLPEPKSTFFAVILCECILAILIIAGALGLKFFMPKTYAAAKQWYEKNLTPDTSVTDITDEL